MQALLLKHKPKDQEEAKFKESWERSGYFLSALYKAINELAPEPVVKGEDFDTPNHYSKLVWQLGQRDLAKKILALFPENT